MKLRRMKLTGHVQRMTIYKEISENFTSREKLDYMGAN
jgi:hypothetical protein